MARYGPGRVKDLWLQLDDLLRLLSSLDGAARVRFEGLPGDARLVAAHAPAGERLVVVRVESATFPDCGGGGPVPRVPFRVTVTRDEPAGVA